MLSDVGSGLVASFWIFFFWAVCGFLWRCGRVICLLSCAGDGGSLRGTRIVVFSFLRVMGCGFCIRFG